MDPSDEKRAQRDISDAISAHSTQSLPFDEPEKQLACDPKNDVGIASLRTPRVPRTGTDRDKHLSIELAADKDKRESVESAHFRYSTISTRTEPTHCEGGSISEDTEKQEEGRRSTELPRPQNSRGETAASATTIGGASRRSLPSLRRHATKLAQKEAHPWQHLGITLGLPMILLCDLIVPCIVYYVWYNNNGRSWRRSCEEDFPNQPCPTPRPQYNSDILGYSIICFGFGEVWILGARIHRLFFHPEDCAPLLSRSKWELDATSWVYGVAVLLALIPFVIGAEKEIPKLYLYSPAFIMVFLLFLMVMTTIFPFVTPIGINSHARGTKLRPFIYYAAEDFIAVDGLQDKEFRVRYNERYESNKMFRQFFFHLTLWWMCGVLVYIGCLSAVIWNCEFHVAFGLSFGVLFAFIITWAGTTLWWVDVEMKRENKAYENEVMGA